MYLCVFMGRTVKTRFCRVRVFCIFEKNEEFVMRSLFSAWVFTVFSFMCMTQNVMAGSNYIDFESCEVAQNDEKCVGNLAFFPDGIVLTIREGLPTEVLWKGFVGSPPEDHVCTPKGYRVAFHSDLTGWGESGTWHRMRWPTVIIPVDVPVRGYPELQAVCEEGGKHEMPLNLGYWTYRSAEGKPIHRDEEGLLVIGQYHRPYAYLFPEENTMRMGFGSRKVHSLADVRGLLPAMNPALISSCGFLYWNPDRTYVSGELTTLEDGGIIVDIPHFPLGKAGWLICSGPGEGDIYVARDLWDFPSGTWHHKNGSSTFNR